MIQRLRSGQLERHGTLQCVCTAEPYDLSTDRRMGYLDDASDRRSDGTLEAMALRITATSLSPPPPPCPGLLRLCKQAVGRASLRDRLLRLEAIWRKYRY